MNRRWVEALVVLGLVIALVGGAVLYARQVEQADQFRLQTAEFCERVVDGRGDTQVNREVLLMLVESVLQRGLDDRALVPDFEKARRKLRQPVPSIGCGRFQ